MATAGGAHWNRLRHLKDSVGSGLNKALAEIEDANPATLEDVLKHINFNRKIGKYMPSGPPEPYRCILERGGQGDAGVLGASGVVAEIRGGDVAMNLVDLRSRLAEELPAPFHCE